MPTRSRFRRLGPLLFAALAAAGCGTTTPTASVPPTTSTPGVSAPVLTPVPGVPGASAVPGVGLEPTDGELMLLKGMRLDLQGACGPVRESLPTGAVGEVGCVPPSGRAARVNVDIFDAQQPLLDAYFARAKAAGVTQQSNAGVCADAATAEGAWLPGPDDGAGLAERAACWTEGDGSPVYLTTQPPYVLIMVTGFPDADAETVRQFAWLGNEDVPGAPTVWREVPVDAEK